MYTDRWEACIANKSLAELNKNIHVVVIYHTEVKHLEVFYIFLEIFR